ncbi:adenylate/guanylate cyclase domain-containing protein [Serratia marcescens]|uniref:nucleotide-binding domain-containing protein n=1 Tax=Serratia marcescens TaxID=615 RepID=UPI003204B3B8
MSNQFKDLFGKARMDVNSGMKTDSIRKSNVYADSQRKAIFESVKKGMRNDGTDAFSEVGLENYAENDMPTIFRDVKAELRKLFCKKNEVNEAIGCHPDFDDLRLNDELRNGYAVTMFFDIAGSTKLGKTYPPDMVFNIKNTIIRYVIEIIQAFDGHVHRIMGDAVMAFFRSEVKSIEGKKIDSAIDAINAAVYILEFMEQVIRPELGDQGSEERIGVRVGIDYAKDNEIVWGNYGVSGAFEVTATSYHVDVAAKLQQAADTDTIMIGENLKSLLGLGSEYLFTKCKLVKNEDGTEFKRYYRYVKPNYRVKGAQINYPQYVFDSAAYFKFLPYGIESRNISVVLTATVNNVEKKFYCPCSESLDKGMSLNFHVTFSAPEGQSYTVKAIKRNTGPEAERNSALKEEQKDRIMIFYAGQWHADISESTSYHGLHHMEIKIYDSYDKEVDKTIFSIFIS